MTSQPGPTSSRPDHLQGASRAGGVIRFTVYCSLLTSCAQYHPSPLDLSALPARYDARTLDVPDLRAYITRAGAEPGDSVWSEGALALAALYYRAELDRARAEWRQAIAAEISAGARPQPSLGTDLEYSFAGANGEPRWGVALTTLFTVETGGRRGARIAEARARALAAEAALRSEAWNVVITARTAALELRRSDRALDAAGRELEALRRVVPTLEARYQQGAAGTADLARLRGEIQTAALEVAGLERARSEAAARLATAVGVSVAAARPVRIAPSGGDCERIGELGRDSLQHLAGNSNWDLQRTLAEYQAAEGRLRLEIARQRPNLALGPGLFFDHGISKWTVAFGLPELFLNRNRGPIAEAEAGRSAAAARVEEMQQGVLAAVDLALDGCRAVLGPVAAADSLQRAVTARIGLAQRAFDRGETTRLDLVLLDVEAERAARALLDARERQAEAGLALEKALGAWLEGAPRWPDPRQSPRAAEGATK